MRVFLVLHLAIISVVLSVVVQAMAAPTVP